MRIIVAVTSCGAGSPAWTQTPRFVAVAMLEVYPDLVS